MSYPETVDEILDVSEDEGKVREGSVSSGQWEQRGAEHPEWLLPPPGGRGPGVLQMCTETEEAHFLQMLFIIKRTAFL